LSAEVIVSQSFLTLLETQKSKTKKECSNFSTGGQFHQRSTRSFYVRKFRAQLFCAYALGLYFTGISLPAQKLRVEC
jgi:hypothetical protein